MATVGESYVVRIYRRDPDDPRRVTGLVEAAEPGTRASFRTAADLLRLLGLGRRVSSKTTAKSND
jgi:hypothetical protein